MSVPKLNQVESPFIELLLRHLDTTSNQTTSINPAKHTFDMLMNSEPFHEKHTPVHDKFESVLTKYHTLYPSEFESYMNKYNALKDKFNSST